MATRPAALNKHRIYTQERMHDVRLVGRVKRELQCREKAKQAWLCPCEEQITSSGRMLDHYNLVCNHYWQAESLDELEGESGVLQFRILPLLKGRHTFRRWVFLWVFQCPAKAAVKCNKSSTRCVCVCLCLFNHFVVFNSAVSSHCKKIKKFFKKAEKWHEELIRAGSWNASSLRFDSLWGNKMRKKGRGSSWEWDVLAWWLLYLCQRFQLFRFWL